MVFQNFARPENELAQKLGGGLGLGLGRAGQDLLPFQSMRRIRLVVGHLSREFLAHKIEDVAIGHPLLESNLVRAQLLRQETR